MGRFRTGKSRRKGCALMKRTFTLMLLGAATVVGGAAMYRSGFRVAGPAYGQTTAAPVPVGDIAALTALSDRFEWVAKTVLPAVVSIEANKPATGSAVKGKTIDDSGS